MLSRINEVFVEANLISIVVMDDRLNTIHCFLAIILCRTRKYQTEHVNNNLAMKRQNPFKNQCCCNSVDGGWSEFGAWSQCSASCGTGIKTRSRTCTKPAPEHGGADCVGDDTETQNCNTQPCASKIGGTFQYCYFD